MGPIVTKTDLEGAVNGNLCHFTVNDERQWSYFTADCEIIQDQSVVMEKQPAFQGLHLNHKSRMGYCASLAALRVGSARRQTKLSQEMYCNAP
jgi:hypothetical protein